MTKTDKFYKALTGIVGFAAMALSLLGVYVDDGDSVDREWLLANGLIGSGLFLVSKSIK